MNNTGFSENLKRIRTNKGLTQKELAELIGISEISIRKYESGDRKPKLEILYQIAKALNVNINELFLVSKEDVYSHLKGLIESGKTLNEISKEFNIDEKELEKIYYKKGVIPINLLVEISQKFGLIESTDGNLLNYFNLEELLLGKDKDDKELIKELYFSDGSDSSKNNAKNNFLDKKAIKYKNTIHDWINEKEFSLIERALNDYGYTVEIKFKNEDNGFFQPVPYLLIKNGENSYRIAEDDFITFALNFTYSIESSMAWFEKKFIDKI